MEYIIKVADGANSLEREYSRRQVESKIIRVEIQVFHHRPVCLTILHRSIVFTHLPDALQNFQTPNTTPSSSLSLSCTFPSHMQITHRATHKRNVKLETN